MTVLRATPVLSLLSALAAALLVASAPVSGAAQDLVPSPPPGTYAAPVTVSFQVPSGLTLHYTVDGSEPTRASPAYSAPLTLGSDTVLRFATVDPSGRRGRIGEALYRIGPTEGGSGPLLAVASPPGGDYLGRVRVELRAGEGATVYYTIDGSEPDTNSAVYGSPLLLNTDVLLRFFAVGAGGERGPLRQERYTFRLTDRMVDTTPPQVQAIPSPEEYRSGDVVRLESSEEAVIRFTLDGSEPTARSTAYAQPLTFTGNAVLRFFAVDPSGNGSAVTTLRYTVDTTPPTAEARPPSGMYIPPLTVRLVASEDGAVIRYTLDGSPPGPASPVYGSPLILQRDAVLRFAAEDRFGNRDVERREEYRFDDVPPVTVVEPPGGPFMPPLAVSMRSEEGARILYSLDGRDPDPDSPAYASALRLEGPTVLKVSAVDAIGNREKVQTHAYTLVNGVWRKYARGVFLIPSVTDGRTFWMGMESGVAIYRVGSGDRRVIGEKDGMLGRRINDMVLDERGDLWVATEAGLNRYRAAEGFLHVRREEGLPDREVLTIAVDLDNSLWVGTPKGVAHVVDGMVRQVLTTRDGLLDDVVLCIAVDPAGNKWFGTPRGLSKFTGREWNSFTRESGLVDNEVRTVAIDARWNMWCGTPRGVSVYDRRSWKSYTEQDGLPSSSVVLIAPDRDGEVWVATRSGVVRFAGGQWIRVESP